MAPVSAFNGLTRLAKGDLSFQLSSGFTDDYKQIRDDFNRAIGQLKETIGAISSSGVASIRSDMPGLLPRLRVRKSSMVFNR